MTPLVKIIVGFIISGFVIAFGIFVYAEILKLVRQYKKQNPASVKTTGKKFCPHCGNKI